MIQKNLNVILPWYHNDKAVVVFCLGDVNLIYLQPFLQVISYQKVPKIFVGDSHQQIYQFRGAVDAMKRVDAVKTVHLNQTFRFGA